MTLAFSAFTFLLLFAAVSSVWIAIIAWRERFTVAGARELTIQSGSLAIWCLFFALELDSPTLLTKVFFAKVEYFGITAAPLAWFLSILSYSGMKIGRNRALRNLLWLEPAVILIMAWTNDYHGLIWSHTELTFFQGNPVLAVTHGPWFWVHVAFSYVLLIATTALTLQLIYLHPSWRRREGISLLASAVIPWIGNGIYLFGPSPIPWLDLTPFTFAVSSVVLAWGVFNMRIFQIRPAAVELTIQNMADLMFVLDSNREIMDANPAARRVFELPSPLPWGLRLDDLLEIPREYFEQVRGEGESGSTVGEHIVSYKKSKYEVSYSALCNRRDEPVGFLWLMHDVTRHLWTEQSLHLQVRVSRILETSRVLKVDAETILEEVCATLGWKCGGLWELDPTRDHLALVNFYAAGGLPAVTIQALQGSPIQRNDKLFSGIWLEGKPSWLETGQCSASNLVFVLANSLDCHHGLAMPIRAGDQVVGMMGFFGDDPQWTEDVMELVGSIASQLGQSINKHRVEQALQESETFFHTLVDVIPQNIFCLGMDGRITFANDSYCATLGMPFEKVIGRTDFEIHSPQFAQRYVEEDRQVLESGRTLSFMEEKLMENGESRYFQAIKTPLRGPEGMITGILVIFWDITEKARADIALRESEAKYKSLIDQIPIGVYRTTLEGSFLHLNQAVANILGYDTIDEVIQTVNVKDLFIDPAEREFQIQQRNSTPEVVTNIMLCRRRDGRKIWLRDTGKVIKDENGETAYIDGIVEDISEQRFAEDYLRISEGRYHDLFEEAMDQAMELRLIGDVRNALARELNLIYIFRTIVEEVSSTYGYPLVSLYMINGNSLELQHQVGYDQTFSSIPIDKGVIGRVAVTGKPVLVTNTVDDPDFLGALPGITSEIAIPLIDNKRVVGVLNAESTIEKPLGMKDLNMMVNLCQHVSIAIERARLYTDARDSEKKFKNVIEHSVNGIILIGEEGNIVEWNQGQERISGLQKEEVIGRKIWDVEYELIEPGQKNAKFLKERKKMFNMVLLGEKIDTRESAGELTIQRKDGEIRYVQVIVSQVKMEKGRLVSSVSWDITENRRAEEALRRRGIILNAVAFAAAQFLEAVSWEDCIHEILGRFAQATQSERVYIYKTSLDGRHEISAVQQYAWQNSGETGDENDLLPGIIHFNEHHMQGWVEQFEEGEGIFKEVGRMAGREKELFSSREVDSVAFVPVFTGKAWWGLIAFEHHGTTREWTPDEIEGLMTAADIFGEEVKRSEMERALRTSEAHNNAMLNAIPDIIFRFTGMGEILAFNKKDLGSDMVGKDINQFFSADVSAHMMANISLALGTGDVQVFEFEIDQVGEKQVFEARLVASGENEVLAIVRNVSERAHLEQMKSDFINRAAHDLRTPLTTTTMMADLIQEGGTPAELADYWKIMQTELRREKELIDKLLTVGRLESGRHQVNKEVTPIYPAFGKALEEIRAQAGKKSIALLEEIADDMPSINADLSALQQVFTNLLSNAVKFTPEKGTVRFKACAAAQGIEIRVEDTGMGIPARDIPQLFQRFFRASNAIENEIQGTGVGLYIVQSIVELHNGRLSVKSTLGEGSVFTVWLPAAG